MPTSDCAERSGTQTPLTGYIWPGNRREDGSEDQYTPRPPSASRPPSARPSSSSRPSSAPMSSRSRSVRHSIKVFLSEQRMDAPDTVLAAVNNNDVLMSFFLHIRNQQAGLAALREECADLEEQQRVLWRQVMPADHRRILHAGTRVKHDDGDAAGAGSPLLAAGSSVALQTADDDNNTNNNNNNIIPECDFIDEATDEFDDIYVNHARQCRYKGGKIFKYGEPDIPGHFTEVPVDGGEHYCGLYQNMTEEGVWSFYNDSLRYIMQVKYRFLATSMVAAGPHATCTRLPSGEVDISVTVLPEETQILFYGEAGDYQNLSTAVPVDGNYKNAHVEKHNAAIAGHMQRTAAQRRKSAFEYVTPSEVLQLCDSSPATAGREGVLFVDPEFPPGRESLCGPMTAANAPFFSLPWRRPEEYLPAKDAADVRLFRGLVLPCDACPGDGHDLYLCSAAAILAEQPHCVRSLFRHPAGGEVGKRQRARRAYHITLNIGGWWSPTILDDYVPASKIGPEFGRCEMDLRKLWYPLLQKGYAKMYGSYAAIQCINSNNNNYNSSTSTKESNNNNSRSTINNNSCILSALEDLSGFPTRSIDAAWRAEKQREEGLFRGAAVVRTDAAAEDGYGNHLLSELSDALYRGHSVFLRLPDSGPATSKAARMGLVYGMGYAVLDLVQYHDTQLVQLRCPTAVPDWDGLWCPESIRWRQDPMLTERCGMSGGDALTECVWLDWSEALTMFAGGGICYTALGREDYRVKGQFRENKEASCGRTIPSVVLEVTVTQPVRAYCILSQPASVGQPEQELTPLLLAVSHTVPGGGDTQRVLGVATRNPNISRKTLEFVPERQLAMQVDFVPGGGPYYILPRSQQGSQQQQHGSMAYTLGFLPDRPVDGAALKVRFVRPNPQTCKFFTCEDTMEFAAASLSEATADSVYYQHRDAVGLLVSKAGDSIMI